MVSSKPKSLSLTWEVPILEGGIRGHLRTKVPKFSMTSCNSGGLGGVFLVSSQLKSQSLPWEVTILGEVFLSSSDPKSYMRNSNFNTLFFRIGYSVGFWQHLSPTLASYGITDSLLHVTCVESNNFSDIILFSSTGLQFDCTVEKIPGLLGYLADTPITIKADAILKAD